MLDGLSQYYDPNGRPYEEENTKCCWNEPVQRREVERTTKHNMKWRSVDDEHSKASSSQNTDKVPLVPDDAPPERERQFCFDGKDLLNEK